MKWHRGTKIQCYLVKSIRESYYLMSTLHYGFDEVKRQFNKHVIFLPANPNLLSEALNDFEKVVKRHTWCLSLEQEPEAYQQPGWSVMWYRK